LVFSPVFPPPKNIQLVATAKKQLTVQWEHPDGIKPKGSEMKYKLILRDQFGKCSNNIFEVIRLMSMFQAAI